MLQNKTKGNFLLLITSFIWGVSFIAQSKGVEELSPVAFNGVRSMLGSLVLLPVIFFLDYKKKKAGIKPQKIDKTLILAGTICGILLCLATTVQTAGMKYTGPGKAGFITALYIILIPIAEIFQKKPPRPIILISVLIAAVGLYLMCIDTSLCINKGDVMIFICAFLFAGHILVIDYFSPKTDGVKLSCIQFFVCGLLNLSYMFIFTIPSEEPFLDCAATIIYSGVLSCGVGYTLQIIGQKYTDPTSASILMSLESVFATLSTVILSACGFELTGGQMSGREIIGCIMMFIAIIWVQLPDKKHLQNVK